MSNYFYSFVHGCGAIQRSMVNLPGTTSPTNSESLCLRNHQLPISPPLRVRLQGPLSLCCWDFDQLNPVQIIQEYLQAFCVPHPCHFQNSRLPSPTPPHSPALLKGFQILGGGDMGVNNAKQLNTPSYLYLPLCSFISLCSDCHPLQKEASLTEVENSRDMWAWI